MLLPQLLNIGIHRLVPPCVFYLPVCEQFHQSGLIHMEPLVTSGMGDMGVLVWTGGIFVS